MTDPRSRPAAEHRADFLAGVRVLELGDGVAGAAAASLLWSLGAEVVAVTDPSSPHRRGRPCVVRDGCAAALLSIVLDRGKRLVAVGPDVELPRLIEDGLEGARFDIVIVDRVLGSRGVLSSFPDLASYAAFVEQHNPRAWLTISAFGLSGERAADIATELTVAAAGGMLAAARDQHTGLPLKLAGQQSLLNAGQAGALAACHALDLDRERRSGPPRPLGDRSHGRDRDRCSRSAVSC